MVFTKLFRLLFPQRSSPNPKSNREKILHLQRRLPVDAITVQELYKTSSENTHNSMGLTQKLHYVSPKKKADSTQIVRINHHPQAVYSNISTPLGAVLMKEKQVYRF